MRYLFLFLFLPIFTFGQSNLVETHWTVIFKNGTSELEQQQILRTAGLHGTSKVEHFKTRAIAVIPVQQLDLNVLRQNEQVTHFAPLYSNSKGQFVTYLSTFFVQMKNAGDAAKVQRLAADLGITVIGPDRYLPNVIKLQTSKTSITAIEAIQAFRASGQFSLVSPNLMHTVSDCSVNDPLFSRQWNLKNDGSPLQSNGIPGADMDIETAWDITTGDPNIKIAILDSGVDTLHPDLMGKLLPGFDAMVDPDSSGTNGYPTPTYSQDGHGTSCAGIAAASGDNSIGMSGVCRDCSIIPVRVFAYQDLLGEIQPFSDTESFIRGISWQWQVGQADVSSNSWGVPDFLLAFFPGGDSLVNIAIDAAVTQGRNGKGLPMMFSSGNDGITDSIPIWPARYAPSIAVNSTSMCDERKSTTSCDGESWWAGNFGNHLDCAAPGVRIPTTDMIGTNGFNSTSYYNTFNGTSSACPNAAGVMGLLLSAYPDLSKANAERHLMNGCEKVGDYAYNQWKQHGHWSNELGYGRLNANLTLISAATVGIDEVYETSPIVRTFSDHHSIELPNAKPVQWMLLDINGRTLREGRGQGGITVNHNGLVAGIYALRITEGNALRTVKLVVSGAN